MTTRSIVPLLLLGFTTPALAHGGHEQASSHGHRAPAPTGVVQVVNRAGTVLTVTVDGQAPRTLAPNQTTNLTVLAGEVRVRASYRLFGQEIPLDTARTWVSAGRVATAAFTPATTARLLVSNPTPAYATVLADGREVGTLAPGQERLLVLPARATTVSLLADGHLVRTQRLELRPYDEPRLRVELPTRGDLVVQNPLPIPIQLVCDRGLVRTLEPYGRTEYEDLPVGSFHLTARRLTGELIDQATSRVDPWVDTTWRVDAPTTGVLAVDNDHWLSVKLLVDGRVTNTLDADRDTRLNLALGWHHVEARDESGREILDTWVEIARYEDARVDVGGRHAPPVADADRYDDRQDRYDDRGDPRDHEDDGRYDDHTAATSCTMPSR